MPERALKIRVFNTYEPVTTMYRDLLPMWVEKGWQVQVVISRRDYREGRDRSWAVPGVRLIQTPSGGAKKSALLGYILVAPWKSLFAPRVDLNLFLTQPPLFFCWGWMLRLLRRERYLIMSMDLYPQVAIQDGMLRPGPFAGMMQSLSRGGIERRMG